MATRYVVDTNLLAYALDRREPEKRERAREVLRRRRRRGEKLSALASEDATLRPPH